MKYKLVNFMFLALTTHCAIFGEDEESPVVTHEPSAHQSGPVKQEEQKGFIEAASASMFGKNDDSIKQANLENAKLWNRLKEVEDEVKSQKETITLLKRGVVLGIVPEGLTLDKSTPTLIHSKPGVTTQAAIPHEAHAKIVKPEAPTNAVEDKSGNDQNKNAYVSELKSAMTLYQNGEFPAAILAFSKIDERFSDQTTDGSEHYFIGLSWYKLKSYNEATKHWDHFILRYPKSGYIADAKLHLAKIDLQQDMRERAVKRLKSIIEDYPYEQSAEAARQMLGNMRREF